MSTKSPPNVVFTMCDDLGYGDLSCHGHPYVKTPHLDALRWGGTSLANYHATPIWELFFARMQS